MIAFLAGSSCIERAHALGRGVLSPFQVLVAQRSTIDLFVRREIRSRYVNSILGVSWAVVQPLALLALYTFVFSYVMRVRFTADGSAISFPLYLFCGMLPWLAFADGVNRASSVLVEQMPLVKKVRFPTEILPVYVVLSAIIMEFAGLGVLLVGVVVYGGGLGWSLLLLPVVAALQFLFTTGVGWVLACAGAAIRDVRQVLGLILTLWMFMTPVVYPAEMVPTRFRWVLVLNPLYYVVQAYRDIVLDQRLPQLSHMAVFAGIALVAFVAGHAVFRYFKYVVADLL